MVEHAAHDRLVGVGSSPSRSMDNMDLLIDNGHMMIGRGGLNVW